MQALWAHPQLAARGRWQTIESAAGALPALLPPANSSTFAPRMDAVPALGAHTDAILGELGFSPAEIAHLREERAI